MSDIKFGDLSPEEQLKMDISNVPGFESICEYPFVREGMTWGEYLQEKKYYGEHFQEVRQGTYKPMWLGNRVLESK